jgi:hypothetical protein
MKNMKSTLGHNHSSVALYMHMIKSTHSTRRSNVNVITTFTI